MLKNSLLESCLASLLAMCFGVVAAVFLTGLEKPGRKVLLVCAAAALALPPFLITNCWLHYLGSTGVWHRWLPLNILTIGGAAWILATMLWPLTMFATWSCWRRLEAAQLESDPAVSGWHLLRSILIPMAKPALATAGVATFVLALNNFSVPAILQVKVFPAEMWVRFNTTFDTTGALRMSWPLIAGPVLLLFFFMRQEISWPHLENSLNPGTFRRQLGRKLFFCVAACSVGLCFCSVLLPVWQLASAERTWTELFGAVAAGKPALWNSFGLAAISATIVTALGLFRSPGRRFPEVWKPLSLLFWFPFLVPGVLLGIALIQIFNRPWLSAVYHSSAILMLALVIRYLAVGLTTIVQAGKTVDRDLSDAARLEGATQWQMLRHVHWPQMRVRVMAAWYVVFLLCLWDVESTILIMPPGGETVALRVFNLLHYGHNAQVNALCLTLLAIATAPLVIWRLLTWLMHGNRLALPEPRAPITKLLLLNCFLVILSGCGEGSKQRETLLQSKLFRSVQIIGTRGTGVGELNKPRSVAVDAQDNLYVVDMTGRVQKFSGSGKFLLSWQMPQTDLGKPKGMCRDVDGNIVVVEPHYQRVNHFSPDGKLVTQWGQTGTNEGQFKLPRAVATSARGEIYVSEYGAAERVQRFQYSNAAQSAKESQTRPGPDKREIRFLNSFGKAGNGPGEFNRPEGISVDAQNRVFVADSCNHRIQVFSGEGKFLRDYGKPGTGKGELSYPYDICIDKAGRQYVCEFGNSRIQVFDANNQPLEIIGGPGAEPGRFSNPWGVALDSVGNLYVADSQNHRVQKLIREESPLAADNGRPLSAWILSVGAAILLFQISVWAKTE